MTMFRYGKIVIDSVSSSSVISCGENRQTGFRRTAKVNEGFGGVSGKSNMHLNSIHIVHDPDETDAWRSHLWGRRDEM